MKNGSEINVTMTTNSQHDKVNTAKLTFINYSQADTDADTDTHKIKNADVSADTDKSQTCVSTEL